MDKINLDKNINVLGKNEYGYIVQYIWEVSWAHLMNRINRIFMFKYYSAYKLFS